MTKISEHRVTRALLLVWAVAPTFILTGVWLGLVWLWLTGSADERTWGVLLVLLGAFTAHGLAVFAAEVWLLVRFTEPQRALVRRLRRPNLALSSMSGAAVALALFGVL